MSKGPYSVNDRRDYYRNTYLKSDHWKWVKSVMLSLYPTCQICGSRHRLDVHHRHYHNLYNVSREDLIVLCRLHHSQIHEPIDGAKPTETEVESRLLSLLPLSALTPRERYLSVVHRFFNAARMIESRFGVKLKGRTRKLIWHNPRIKPRSMATAFETALATPKLKRPRKKLTSKVSPERHRYTRVAVRLFTIARKIQREHGIKLLPIVRKMIFSKKPDLTITPSSVSLQLAGIIKSCLPSGK